MQCVPLSNLKINLTFFREKLAIIKQRETIGIMAGIKLRWIWGGGRGVEVISMSTL